MKSTERISSPELYEIEVAKSSRDDLLQYAGSLSTLLDEVTAKIRQYNDHINELEIMNFKQDPKWLEKDEEPSDDYLQEK